MGSPRRGQPSRDVGDDPLGDRSSGLRVGRVGHASMMACGLAGRREAGTAGRLVLPSMRCHVTAEHEC